MAARRRLLEPPSSYVISATPYQWFAMLLGFLSAGAWHPPAAVQRLRVLRHQPDLDVDLHLGFA